MKHLITIAAAVFTLASAPLLAQTNTAVSGSQSASGAISGSSANNTLIFPSSPRKTEVETVPSVFAPSITSSHPCLAGKSGGISVLGGGVSGGISTIEASCMLAYLGQQEAAIRALASASPEACRALNNVGYYVVPAPAGKTRAVAFKCEKRTIRGGIYSNNTVAVGQSGGSSTVSSKSSARVDLKVNCVKREDGAIVPRVSRAVADAYSMDQIKAACR